MYVYVLVRNDLSPIQQLVQVGHALHESGVRFGAPEGGVSLVVLAIPDEPALLDAAGYVQECSVRHVLSYEPDPVIPIPGYTALATEPIEKEDRHIFAHYPLLEIDPGGSRSQAIAPDC